MSDQDKHIDTLLARVHPSRRAFIRQSLIGTTALALGVASSTLLAQDSGAAAGKAKANEDNPGLAKGAGKGKGNEANPGLAKGAGKGKGEGKGNMPMMDGSGKGKGGMNMEGAGKGKGGMNMEGAGKGKGSGSPQ
jgi:hypothetical protein